MRLRGAGRSTAFGKAIAARRHCPSVPRRTRRLGRSRSRRMCLARIFGCLRRAGGRRGMRSRKAVCRSTSRHASRRDIRCNDRELHMACLRYRECRPSTFARGRPQPSSHSNLPCRRDPALRRVDALRGSRTRSSKEGDTCHPLPAVPPSRHKLGHGFRSPCSPHRLRIRDRRTSPAGTPRARSGRGSRFSWRR